ncbi:glycoside hydrolase 3 protein [Phytophthora pseudosyringae]|uniref:Glycoside hydrolase 3 protein n=1 Tax=Phytophthora pseudosyringae TaxID=221518 RepID=A0A8T1VF24_9STRA|nr:glycoside hydrolase 3 protein [Phytophthora pseudosyringae]
MASERRFRPRGRAALALLQTGDHLPTASISNTKQCTMVDVAGTSSTFAAALPRHRLHVQHPRWLVDEIDYVSANLSLFCGSVVPTKAASYFLSTYTRLVNLAAAHDQSGVIRETVRATNGSLASSVRYFHDFYVQEQEQNNAHYYFSAFGKHRKGPDTVEAYFGLFYEDDESKPQLDDEASASTGEEAVTAFDSSTAASEVNGRVLDCGPGGRGRVHCDGRDFGLRRS